MNLDKQRIAAGMACGWSPLDPTIWRRGGWKRTIETKPPGKHLSRQFLPDYLDDLDAMHEAEKTLTAMQRVKYVLALAKVVNAPGFTTLTESIFATAEQRAEAFLRALDLWEEDK